MPSHATFTRSCLKLFQHGFWQLGYCWARGETGRQSKLDDEEKHRERRDRETAQWSQNWKDCRRLYMLVKRCCLSTARSAEVRINIYSRFQLRLNQVKRCCSVCWHKSPCTLTLSFATRINWKVCFLFINIFTAGCNWLATQCFI